MVFPRIPSSAHCILLTFSRWSTFMISTIIYFLMTSNFLSSAPPSPLSFRLAYSTACERVPPGCPTGISNTTCSKMNSMFFSLSQYLLSYSLSQLPVRLSNPLPKLGILFDSSYSLMPQIRSTDNFFKTGLVFFYFSFMPAVFVLV